MGVTTRTGVRFRIPMDCCFLGITILSWTMTGNGGTTSRCRAVSQFVVWRSTQPAKSGSAARANWATCRRTEAATSLCRSKLIRTFPLLSGKSWTSCPAALTEYVRTEKALLVHQNDSWNAISWPHGNGFDFIVSATANRVFVHGKDGPLYEMIDGRLVPVADDPQLRTTVVYQVIEPISGMILLIDQRARHLPSEPK